MYINCISKVISIEPKNTLFYDSLTHFTLVLTLDKFGLIIFYLNVACGSFKMYATCLLVFDYLMNI